MSQFGVNPELIKVARASILGFDKRAFVPASDPGMGAGGGDPAAGGGGDPAAGGGGGGGGGGGDPGAGGGGGGDPMASLQPMIQQAVQQAMMQQGGGMGGGMGGAGGAAGQPLKPKIDVNVEMMQIKNMLAKICDQLGVQIPAQDMVATPDKLMAMSQGQPTTSPAPGGGAGGAGGAGGGGAVGGMSPMGGMQGAGVPGGEKTGSARRGDGTAFNTTEFDAISNRAAAIARVRRAG